MTVQQIVAEARQLPRGKRANLIEALVADSIDPAVEGAWIQTAKRRLEEMESGKVRGIPLDESLAKARRILKRGR